MYKDIVNGVMERNKNIDIGGVVENIVEKIDENVTNILVEELDKVFSINDNDEGYVKKLIVENINENIYHRIVGNVHVKRMYIKDICKRKFVEEIVENVKNMKLNDDIPLDLDEKICEYEGISKFQW